MYDEIKALAPGESVSFTERFYIKRRRPGAMVTVADFNSAAALSRISVSAVQPSAPCNAEYLRVLRDNGLAEDRWLCPDPLDHHAIASFKSHVEWVGGADPSYVQKINTSRLASRAEAAVKSVREDSLEVPGPGSWWKWRKSPSFYVTTSCTTTRSGPAHYAHTDVLLTIAVTITRGA